MTIWYKVHWAYIIACVYPRMLRTAMHVGQFIGLGPPPVWKIWWVKPSSVGYETKIPLLCPVHQPTQIVFWISSWVQMNFGS